MNKARTVVTGMAALAAVAALGACSNSATKEAATSSASAPASSSSSAAASTSAAAAPHNHADMMFAQMMIPHHQQAIEMSDIVLGRNDIDPRVVQLATQIKDAQGPEITQMQGWLDQWNKDMGMGDMPGHGGMTSGSMMPGMGNMGMDGMLSADEMDALKVAEGIDASKLFLTGMIKHHQGAIDMSQDEVKNGQAAEAVALAKSIIESQQKEIDTMNQILSTL